MIYLLNKLMIKVKQKVLGVLLEQKNKLFKALNRFKINKFRIQNKLNKNYQLKNHLKNVTKELIS